MGILALSRIGIKGWVWEAHSYRELKPGCGLVVWYGLDYVLINRLRLKFYWLQAWGLGLGQSLC